MPSKSIPRSGRVAHYHQCPECYEYEACTMACTITYELGEHKGCPIASHAICSRCERTTIGTCLKCGYHGPGPRHECTVERS